MEDKKSDKKPIVGSMTSKPHTDEDSMMVSEIIDDKENTDSSVIRNKGESNGGNDNGVREQKDLMIISFPTGNDSATLIKQENLALSGVESPNDQPSAIPTTIKNDDLEDNQKLKYLAKVAEIGEVREENERLKLLLARVLKDYQSLQSNIHDIFKDQEQAKEEKENHISSSPSDRDHRSDDHDQLLVSLSLGRASSNDDDDPRKSVEKKIGNESNNNGTKVFDKLALGLGSSSTSHSADHDRDDQAEPTEIWPPSKVLKRSSDQEDRVSQMSPLKKARVSVRTRCDTPTMNDGCQWRKYGQKISKGNPLPRAYYRCTVSTSCPVRKQVQRCVEDMSILITTYEGTHNHPLSVSATAMASATAAAASMLQSRSTTSSPSNTASATSALTPNNFMVNRINPSNNNNHSLLFHNYMSSAPSSSSSSISLPSQFYLPNTSISTLNSHPTVTLDLTVPNPNPNSNSLLGRSASSSLQNPRYPATCLGFSLTSSSSSSTLDLPSIMANNYNSGYGFNYGNYVMAQQARNSYNNIGNFNNKQQPCHQDQLSKLFQPYTNMILNSNNNNSHTSNNYDDQRSLMTESIAAATKAITANPKFQSALAAALTSFVGNGGGGDGSSGNGV